MLRVKLSIYSKLYIDMYKTSIFVVMETRCEPSRLQKYVQKSRFDEVISLSNMGHV